MIDFFYCILGNKQALISVSDKKELEFIGKGLCDLGYTIISTRGTANALENAGVTVTKVEHFDPLPDVHAYHWVKDHLQVPKSHWIDSLDVLVMNLYPPYDSKKFAFENEVEFFDLGGPGAIADIAKRYKDDVLIVVDPQDYPAVLNFLKGNEDDLAFRRMLASKALDYAICYEKAYIRWLVNHRWKDIFPSKFDTPISLEGSLRYGEKHHQKAALYVDEMLSEVYTGPGIAKAIQHHGKEMSYNDYLDADVAWNCVSDFKEPTCVIVKHTIPFSIASHNDILEAYRLAVEGGPLSAFRGIVVFNVQVDEALAREIQEFYKVIVAPSYTKEGLEILRVKSKTLRILEAKKDWKGKISLRQIGGGWLAQKSDYMVLKDLDFFLVSKKGPTESEFSDAKFAWLCAKHIKSNAIVIAKNNRMVGMGSAQPNQVESLRIALKEAGAEVKGAALASSNGFFSFGTVEEACQNGISVISKRLGGFIDDDDDDDAIIECCNKYGVSLLFINARPF